MLIVLCVQLLGTIIWLLPMNINGTSFATFFKIPCNKLVFIILIKYVKIFLKRKHV